MSKKNELLKLHEFENNIPYKRPENPVNLHERTLTSITNALDAEAYLDAQGQLWIAKDKLHQILRTTKANANDLFDSFDDIKRIGDYLYVRAYQVMGIISKEIEEADTLKKGKYLSFSEQCLIAIRDSDRAKVKRAEYLEEWREKKKSLKKQRIKKYDIEFDELTGKTLVRKTAEFSHIRSSSLHKSLSLDIENGLIVNKSTHDLITSLEVCDEEELKFLCEQEGWNVSWYDKYQEYLREN
ncbi:hypothetical protein RRU94_15710 [Domibacillus sp. DTU_2020_1001157_1_SI_ALB_TIR_016]|uniref:hypothetical protein n=1 Tax=Domibacillus sp. DTU_2020_1001157_1_SI_ALB_TIR_016 TaxID=3077789 RepID=UPI0028ECE185|nr:hypothetical protein [Domibacillus sp. DTU_2020_1001157_1_SI_ALB_TIR_016]WNS82192.1 hypothetical protein RRU94_15710 [Domibacillus sp. DTU_2020_1001157_1_SI_ALB_TIR_016]